MASVEFDDRKIIKALQDLKSAVGDLSPAFKVLGDDLVESTKQRFETSKGPDGNAWEDNSDVTIDRKGRNKPLVDEGSLAEQISYAITGEILEIGSSMEYAAMQQFGGTKSEFPFLWGDIPARPFLGISSEDETNILAIIEDFLTDSID